MLYRRSYILAFLVLAVLPWMTGCGDTNTSSSPTTREGVTPIIAQELPATATIAPATQPPDTAQPAATRIGADLYDIGEPATSKPEFSTSLAVMGVIKYKGTVPRTNPQVEVTLYDAGDKVLAKGNALIAPAYIKPQSNIPYKALFSNPPQAWSKVEVSISAKEADSKSLTYGDLEVGQPSLVPPQDSSDSVKLAGNVKNTGSKEASLITVIACYMMAEAKLWT